MRAVLTAERAANWKEALKKNTSITPSPRLPISPIVVREWPSIIIACLMNSRVSLAVLSFAAALTASAVGLVTYERLQGRPMRLNLSGLPKAPVKSTATGEESTAPK